MKFTKPVFSETKDELRKPLLDLNEESQGEAESQESVDLPNFRLYVHVFGLSLGVIASIIASVGTSRIGEDATALTIALFSVAFSSITSIIAFCLFSFIWSATIHQYKDSPLSEQLKDEEYLSKIETSFAIGVFLGFCGVCVVTDFVRGDSLIFVGCTVLGAIFWASLMVYCGTGCRSTKEERKGTTLPMVLV